MLALVIVKERLSIEEERRHLEAEALRERAAQEGVTVNATAAAERARGVALLQARRELELTGQKAQAMELLDFATVEPEAMLKKVAEHVPALREAMGSKG